MLKKNFPSSSGVAVRLRWERAEEKAVKAKADCEKAMAEIAARKEYLNERKATVEFGRWTENSTTTYPEIHNTDKPIEKRIGHFIDNDDGTVTDTRSGLTWMRFAMGQTWDGRTCLGVEQEYSYHEANTLHHSFAGHDDWRLPTCDELRLIVDPNREYPSIKSEAFPRTATSWFWSSSPFDNDPSHAWIVNFGNGYVSISNLGNNKSVRLVRCEQNVGLLDQKTTAHHVTSVAAAEIAAKQKMTTEEEPNINRLGAALVNTETQRILDAKKSALQARASQANAAIERISTTEINAVSAAVAPEESATEVPRKQKPAEEIELIGSLFDVVSAPVERPWILDSENISTSERFAQNASSELNTEELLILLNDFKPITSVVQGPEVTRIIGVEAAPLSDTFEKKEPEEKKLYNFILTHELEMLKADDQWFEETTYFMLRIQRGVFRFLEPYDQWFTDPTLKRGLREGAAKPFEWILPFMSYEVLLLKGLKEIVKWGPNSASQLAKPLRALIRERKKSKEPYDILLYALYISCVLTDFVKSLSFEGTPINIMARYVDVRELRNTHIDYFAIGYKSIETLSKTDVKWMVDAFGEPAAHQTFNALWPSIRQNAISRYCWEELHRENKSIRYTQMLMGTWLPKLVNRNNWLAKSTVWIERKFVRRVQFAGKPEIVQSADSAKLKRYTPPPPHIFSLDMGSIETKLAETVAVSAILKDIFSEDAPVQPQATVSESITAEATIADLDAESFTFMQVLASKRIWTRDELKKLAVEHNLMLDGTLDSINDAFFDQFGAPFFEGDDPVEISQEIVSRLYESTGHG